MSTITSATGGRTMSEVHAICQFSCGAASAVATKIFLSKNQGINTRIIYCDTGSEDKDNLRFLSDCEKWFGKKVEILKGKYVDTWDVWINKKYISGVNGAPCTRALKIDPQFDFRNENYIHVFGYTSDGNDIKRANAIRENWPKLKVETPLIDHGINKAACLSMIDNAGIPIPRVYSMGFHNANCIPCCKAQSPGYWALVRKEFPAEFLRMAELSRRLGARLARLNGCRVFVDEIPIGFPTTEPITPECDFLCHIAEHTI